ncbi:hypothetical protein D3C71_1016090 [compost metagenome]
MDQLQRGHLPVALADAHVDRVAGIPALLAGLVLVLRRGQDPADLAGQVDPGRLTEAVIAHVVVEPLDAHVQGQLVVVRVDRLGDRLAQVGPAVAATVGVAPAARGARQVEHAGGEDPVLRFARAAVQPGQADQWLDGRARRHPAQHQAIELGPRRIAVERLEIGMRNAVDEQVRVVGRQADHGQDLAGTRVHRHRRAFELAEGRHHRPLQVRVDGQPQVAARLRRDPPDGADRTPLHVGLHLLVADLAAQLGLVIALQPGFADMGQRGVAFAEDLQVLVVDPADVADDVREQVTIGVAPGQVGFQLHAGIAPAVHGKARHLLVADTQLEGDRQELAAGLARLVEGFDVLGGEREDLRQPGQGGVHVLDLVRGDVQPERGHVLGEQAPVAVVDHAAPGHHRPRFDAVGFRAGGVDVVIEHLQLEVPAAQPQQADQHAEEAQRGAAPELLGFGMGVLGLAAHVHVSDRDARNGPHRAARTATATAPCPAAGPTSTTTAGSVRRPRCGPPR